MRWVVPGDLRYWDSVEKANVMLGHWYDCRVSYAHTVTLFTILLMFLRCSDHAATSATSCTLHFFIATFLQLVLHIGRGHWFTIQITLYLGKLFPHTLQYQLLAFEKCTLSTILCLFATFAHFYDFDHIIHWKLIPDIPSIRLIT